jgi:drug/metabolite transporter (DMT)-like permease
VVLMLVGGSLDLDIDTGIMMLIGIIAGAQQFLMTSSFRYAEASLLAPLQYLVLVFAGFIGWVFWGEVPTTAAVVGAVIITVCGVFIVRRQTRRA